MAFEYYKSAIGFSCAGNFAAIVQHWGVDTPTGAGPFSRAKSLVAAMESPVAGSAYLPAIADCLADDCFISSVRIAKVTAGGGNQYAKVFAPGDHPGDFGGNIDAAQVAGCIIWLSAGDAGLTGRTFLPGVSEDGIDNGRFNGSYFGALDDLVDIVIPGIQATTGTYLPFIKHGSPAAFKQIVHGRLSLTAGTIRKRLKPV